MREHVCVVCTGTCARVHLDCVNACDLQNYALILFLFAMYGIKWVIVKSTNNAPHNPKLHRFARVTDLLRWDGFEKIVPHGVVINIVQNHIVPHHVHLYL